MCVWRFFHGCRGYGYPWIYTVEPKAPITCKIDSRSESKSFFSFYSYNNLLFLEFLKWVRIRCRSIVLTRSFSNGIRPREASLSVVISDLSLVFMGFTEEKSLSTVTDVCGTVSNNCDTLWTDGKMSLSHSANTSARPAGQTQSRGRPLARPWLRACIIYPNLLASK